MLYAEPYLGNEINIPDYDRILSYELMESSISSYSKFNEHLQNIWLSSLLPVGLSLVLFVVRKHSNNALLQVNIHCK